MSEKKTKQAKKFTVRQVLSGLQWSVNGSKLELLSPLTDEFVTIDLNSITDKNNGIATE